MKENFRCPRCKTMQSLGKRLHAKWECPHCHNTIIPTRNDQRKGYRPFKYNSMFASFSTLRHSNTETTKPAFKPRNFKRYEQK